LFARFDAALAERGYLPKGGQIVDATIVEARCPRLTQAEKDVVKGGGVPEDWMPACTARTRQIDGEHSFVRRFTVTRAAAHDGAQLERSVHTPRRRRYRASSLCPEGSAKNDRAVRTRPG
jgi:hypothetical protein